MLTVHFQRKNKVLLGSNIVEKLLNREINGNNRLYCQCDMIKFDYNFRNNRKTLSRWISIRNEKNIYKMKVFIRNEFFKLFKTSISYCNNHNIEYLQIKDLLIAKTKLVNQMYYMMYNFTGTAYTSLVKKYEWSRHDSSGCPLRNRCRVCCYLRYQNDFNSEYMFFLIPH